MKNCQGSQLSSRKDISWLLEDAYRSTISKVISKEKMQVINQLAITLERLLMNYNSTIRNYRLLTVVYAQKTEENLKQVSSDIRNTLEKSLKKPSHFHEMESVEVAEFGKKADELNQSLQAINQNLAAELNLYKKNWLNTVSLTRHILRIPDLARELKDEEDLLSCMDEIQNHLNDVDASQEKKEIRTLKDEWDRLVATFKRYKSIESYEGIKKQYAFSDETIDVIKGLLNEQEISLSSISSEVLREITRFEDFCNIVKLKFQPSERKT